MQMHDKQNLILKAFEQKKVLTLGDLATVLGCCERTVQRHLANWTTFRSYNHNGRYFTMEGIVHFDDNGLWKYKKVFFSKFGNLRQTIIGLVHASYAGLTGKELGKLLGLLPRSFLWHFRNDPLLYRKQIEGLYVYFSNDPLRQKSQVSHQMRLQETKREQAQLPSPDLIIAVLVELVKSPDSAPGQLKNTLATKGCFLARDKIELILSYYDLVQKKT